jgi:hypothetical protein
LADNPYDQIAYGTFPPRQTHPDHDGIFVLGQGLGYGHQFDAWIDLTSRPPRHNARSAKSKLC